MKAPLILTFIILAVASFWSMSESKVLTSLRLRHLQVTREAAALGISSDFSKPYVLTKASKRQREDSGQKVRDFVAEMVVFAKEMKKAEKSGNPPDEATQKRMMEVMENMLSFNGDELKLLIAEIRNSKDMDDKEREGMIMFSIMMLAQQHPETVLEIFTESSDLLGDNEMNNHMLSTALSQFAKDQPLQAAEWIKKNAEKHPELVTYQTRHAVLSGVALHDFGLAFQLGAELKQNEDDLNSASIIAMTANTPERQTDFLIALRKHAANTVDQAAAEKLLATGMKGLFYLWSESGYDKAMEWMNAAKLSASESANIAENLSYYQTKADTAKWLDWLSTQPTTGEKSADVTRNLVQQWTENDYKAAGEWLAAAPDGPLKEAATISYLETVAPYDPDVAEQWANTLPDKSREKAMRRIHEELKKKDAPAAEAFATKHGILEK